MQATERETRGRTGQFEAIETLVEGTEGALVHGRDEFGNSAVAFVPSSPAAAARERERLLLLRGPGVPVAGATLDGRPDASPSPGILLPELGAARPLHRWGALPVPSVRAAAVTLLSALSHVHSTGLVHGALGRDWIVADGEGGFWITGWAKARTHERGADFGATTDAACGDLGDLGRALLRASLGSPWPDAAEMAPEEVREAASRIATTDRELARVLTRLATTDPREFYGGASEALSDLGATDLSLPEPWEEIPFVGRRRHVDAAMALLDAAGTPSERVASLDFVGGPGSGKTRLLREIARAARAHGAIVFTGDGRAESQGLGALGALLRQLAAHVPHDSPVRTRHAGFLDRLTEGSRPQQRASAEDSVGIVGPLVDLVRAAAGPGAAVLAIDDVHLLPRLALDAWMALGRYVEAVGAAEGPLRILLVTTAETVPPPEPGVRRERRELADWGRLHVHALLARILTEAGSAAVLAVDIHRLVGGRPREVVETLRDLESRGALVPAGRKWRLVDGPHGLEAPAAADRARRGLELSGRDGAALAETVAAAGSLRLHRDELAELACVPSHRMQGAAEAAVRAGLLVRHGSGWRVRSESLRRRIELALTDERRRGLHREFVARLLDTRPDDLPALALHARRSGDPRALDWTRAASYALRAAGRPVEAAEHLEEGIADCGLGTGADGWRDLVATADALVDAGLIAKAEAITDGLLSDPRCPPARRADGLLVKARMLRIDNRFHTLAHLELPSADTPPAALARLRFYRAGALAMIGRTHDADRELRLGAAETPSPEDASAAEYERLQALHLMCFAVRRCDEAHQHLAALIRRARTRASRFDLIRFIAAKANLYRIQVNTRAAIRWIRVARRLTVRLGAPPALMSIVQSNMGIIESAAGRTSTAIRCYEHALALQSRSGSELDTSVTRLRLSVLRTHVRGSTSDDIRYVLRLASSISDMRPDEVSALWERLGVILLMCSLEPPLEVLRNRVPASCARVMEVRVTLARLCLDAELRPSCDHPPAAPPSNTSGDFRADLEYALQALDVTPEVAGDLETTGLRLGTAIAWSLRRHPLVDQESFSCLTQRLSFLADAYSWDDWGPLDFVATALLVLGHRLASELRQRLTNKLCASRIPVPPAVQWRRDLAGTLEHARAGRIGVARIGLARTERAIGVLERPEFGAIGMGAAAGARALVLQLRGRLDPLLGCATGYIGPMPSVGGGARIEDRLERVLREPWAGARASVDASQRVVVLSRHLRELESFAASLGEGRDDCVLFGATGSMSGLRGDPGLILLVAPNLWSEEAANSAFRHVAPIASQVRLIALITTGERGARELSPGHKALLDLASGAVISLPAATEGEARRPRLFEAVLNGRAGAACLDEGASAEIAYYDWPGGLVEMENVAAELRHRGAQVVTEQLLASVGWQARLALSGTSAMPELPRSILSTMGREGSAAIRDLVVATGRPSRTVLRSVTDLVASGHLTREGKGRATRYRVGARAG